MPSTRRRKLFALASLGGAALVGLLLAELALQAFATDRYHVWRPGEERLFHPDPEARVKMKLVVSTDSEKVFVVVGLVSPTHEQGELVLVRVLFVIVSLGEAQGRKQHECSE